MTPPTEEGDKLTAAMELRRLEAWLKAVPLSDLSLLPLTEDEAAELHVAFSAMWNGVDFMRKGGWIPRNPGLHGIVPIPRLPGQWAGRGLRT